MERFRVCFAKSGILKYISHLDLQRTFVRAFRRAKLPLVYSQGFNPQPRVIFAAPLGVGLEGKNEYFDLFLTQQWKVDELAESINRQLPPGLIVKDVNNISLADPPIPALVEAALYLVGLETEPNSLQEKISNLISAEQLLTERKSKKGTKLVDIRPFILDLWVKRNEGFINLFMLLVTGGKGGTRPEEILELLQMQDLRNRAEFSREDLFFRENEKLITPGGITLNNISGV